ncbi:MAG TPA: hypothetical protein VHZ55_20180 [Bryobacteraceae bacterium]|nr:hypothetical protein [Bryobacteraceae bacterium]
MSWIKLFALLSLSSSFGAIGAAQTTTFEGYPAVALSSDKLELRLMMEGSTLASIVLKADPEKLNPLWNPMRMARELGQPAHYDGGAGLFVCVDGFGPVSPEEKAAGLPMHGEAHRQIFEAESKREGAIASVTMRAKLPIVEEVFTRTFRVHDGESVVLVESELDNELGFDRPVNWAEHATIGSPFLESGATVVDLSGSQSRTRPYDELLNGRTSRRLTSGQDFTWPLAPGLHGEAVDLRQTPDNAGYLDHATTLMDSNRDLEWATALNAKKGLLLGYIFKRAEYPWLQYWGNYPATGKFARGMEFGTQPFDVSRREAVSTGAMFGVPTYRWLPAHSKITSRFLVFYTLVPQGLQKVDDVHIENHQIIVEDRSAHKTIRLPATADLQP